MSKIVKVHLSLQKEQNTVCDERGKMKKVTGGKGVREFD